MESIWQYDNEERKPFLFKVKSYFLKSQIKTRLFLSEKEQCIWLGDQGRTGARRADNLRKGTFTLNSSVPSRRRGQAWQGQKGPRGRQGGCWGAGTLAAPRVVRRYPCGGARECGSGGGCYDFCEVQMLNMQMSNRIVLRWIGSLSWFASGQSLAGT